MLGYVEEDGVADTDEVVRSVGPDLTREADGGGGGRIWRQGWQRGWG